MSSSFKMGQWHICIGSLVLSSAEFVSGSAFFLEMCTTAAQWIFFVPWSL